MRGWKLGLTAVLALFMSSCLPFSCTLGQMGLPLPLPLWQMRTQFAYWDAKYAKKDGHKITYEDNLDSAGGKILNIQLFGFTFDPNRDRRTWTAEEWQHFDTGVETQPYLLLQVAHAGGLKNGDELDFDSETSPAAGGSIPNQNDPVLLTPVYSTGSGLINPLNADYPDKATALGSKVTAKLKLTGVPDGPGPLFLVGSVEYTVEKGNGDPDEVATGKYTIQFSAPMLGERLAECNEAATSRHYYAGLTTSSEECGNMDAYQD